MFIPIENNYLSSTKIESKQVHQKKTRVKSMEGKKRVKPTVNSA